MNMRNLLVCDGEGGIILIYLLAFVIGGAIWGLVTKKVAESKGYYYDNSFWWGFFLGFIGLIVILVRPDNHNQEVRRLQPESTYPTDSGRWICSNCGTENGSRSTCLSCGAGKPQSAAGSWRCQCGKINAGYTGTCSCGRNKYGAFADPRVQQSAPVNATPTYASPSNPAPANTNEVMPEAKFREIKAYKELLDTGIITQEEFDKKKRELLGL